MSDQSRVRRRGRTSRTETNIRGKREQPIDLERADELAFVLDEVQENPSGVLLTRLQQRLRIGERGERFRTIA